MAALTAHASSTVGTSGERVPRLVLRFAVLTALGLAVAAAVIVALARHAYTAQGEQNAIDHARLTAEGVLQRQLRASDLAGKVSAGRRRQLDRLFTGRVLVAGTLGAAVYNAHGQVVYSTGDGAPSSTEARTQAREALGGTTIAKVSSSATGSGRVLTTYLPFRIDPGASRGVVALEQDYGPIAAAARHSTLAIAGVLEGVLLALFLLLLPMLARASSRIRAHVDELDRLATHDELTGLANRAGFYRMLEVVLGDPHEAGAVLVVDIDNFHELNDTLGFEQGDELLVQAAERIGAIGAPAFVARIGEDEFALLLPGADGDEILRAVETIREAFRQPLQISNLRVAAEPRAGCALFPMHGREPALLFRRAGLALSIAKQRSTPAEVYDPDDDASDVSRLTLTAELRQALQESQLTIYYQPQADLTMNVIRGVEALVRWEHPERGLLNADMFVPQAERTGLITDLDRFVLAAAAEQWQRWHASGITLDVAVNLAPADLLDPHLPQEIEELIARHGLPAEYLVLEITERTLLRDERRTRRSLEQLHRIGARLAIDDYGTGYSSLAYLRMIPARQVKLDRSLIASLPEDARTEAIVRSTIELAHGLGATVVGEGIETRAQWEHLARLGCDIAQGRLIGEPVPADELHDLLAAGGPAQSLAWSVL